MDSTYLSNPAIFLLQLIFGGYILIVMLRFVLQIVRADFRNPISQFVVKATTPILHPLRRYIPSIAGLDTSAILLMWALKTLEIFLTVLILTQTMDYINPIIWAIPALVEQAFNLFIFALFIQVILSWVNQGGYNPASSIITSLTQPVLRPFQRIVPTFSGLDFSTLVAIICLQLAKMLVLPPLMQITQSPHF